MLAHTGSKSEVNAAVYTTIFEGIPACVGLLFRSSRARKFCRIFMSRVQGVLSMHDSPETQANICLRRLSTKLSTTLIQPLGYLIVAFTSVDRVR